jgi:hypothetical protein
MMRERLPARRAALTKNAVWAGATITVTVGFALDGRVLEVFARDTKRADSQRALLTDDVAVLVSRLLQHGDRLADIARGLGRLPPDGRPSSLAGAIVDAALELERGA